MDNNANAGQQDNLQQGAQQDNGHPTTPVNQQPNNNVAPGAPRRKSKEQKTNIDISSPRLKLEF